MSSPTACRPEAFSLFAEQVPRLETCTGLLRAAVAISMHALPEVVPVEIEQQIGQLASRIRHRVHGKHRQAMLAHLHEELFERQGLRGNVDDYDNPNNSYLPVVLETGLGIPITLSLVYKLVATRVGLRAEGINAPGHFLVQVAGGAKPMLIDAFHGGRLLTRTEAFQRMDEATGRTVARSEYYLMPATHRQWIQRMLRNLARVSVNQGQPERVAAMTELGQLLGTSVL